MDTCKHCGKAIWIWPNRVWTHRGTDSQLCYTGPGGDYTKIASPKPKQITEAELRAQWGDR